MPDPGKLASDIADKEAQLETEKNAHRAEAIRNEIHGMQINLQHEIAVEFGEDFDPGENKS
jgi:hypothetical protein